MTDSNKIRIRINGNFCCVFDDDCYILNYLFDYKIIKARVGFPKSAFDKVINVLEENKINYEVVGEDKEIDFKNLNNYNKFLELGLEKNQKENFYSTILDKIKNANEEQLDNILNYIIKVLDE